MKKTVNKKATKKTKKEGKKTGNPAADTGGSSLAMGKKTAVVTAYLMNGDKMEFGAHATLNDVRVAAANELDPKRFAPEITVWRDGKKLDGKCARVPPGVVNIVAFKPAQQDRDFWIRAIDAHSMALDTGGVERVVAELDQATLDGFLLRCASRVWSPQNKRLMESLLRHGANVNAVDEEGNTGIIRGLIKRRQVDSHNKRDVNWPVDVLIKHGADVNRVNQRGQSSLYMAAERGREDAAALLIKHGADVDAADRNGHTSLMRASIFNRDRMIDLLIKQGADVNRVNHLGISSLHKVAEYARLDADAKNTHIVALLIKGGADVDAADRDGNTILKEAAGRKGNTHIVALLIKHGADVDVAGHHGQTSLMMAIQTGNARIVDLLVKHGADVNRVNFFGESPLMMAARRGDEYTVCLLLDHQADINARDRHGNTILEQASQYRETGTVRLLLDRGAI